MNKFLNLLVKEVKELITLQLLVSLLFTIFLFYFIGQMAKTEMKKAMRTQKIAVLNLDDSPFSEQLIGNLKTANFQAEMVKGRDKQQAIDKIKTTDTNLLLVIPQGFGQSLETPEVKEIETYSYLRTFSLVGSRSSIIINTVIRAINEYLSNDFIKKKIPDFSPDKVKNPIKSRDFIIVKDRMAEGKPEAVAGFVSSQSLIVPVILAMIIIYASQMVISAIAMEKQNKTLETLLTVPISRTSIVMAKMLASGLVGLVSAVIYMFGFRYYMSGFMGDINQAAAASGVSGVIQKLGLTMDTRGFLILGVALFIAILVALALATILGVLAEDYRSAQSLILPLLFLVMIPYFISIFSDPKTLSLPAKILLYAIPFSHPFLITQNLYLENYSAVLYGVLYMLAVFIILIIVAARIFSTDKVLTMKLKFRKKKLQF
jgi:ABC-2 type transport system permease protein